MVKKKPERQAVQFDITGDDPNIQGLEQGDELNAGDNPDVTGVLKYYEKKRRRRNLTPAQRRKAARDAQREKLGFYLPPSLIKSLGSLAREWECTISNLVTFFLERGLDIFTAQQLLEHRELSGSLRADYELVIPIEGEKMGRVVCDVPRRVQKRLRSLARELQCSISSVVRFLIWDGIEVARAGGIEPYDYSELLLHPRWRRRLVWENGKSEGGEDVAEPTLTLES